MNCLIIAGEKSGEEHCLSFLSEIKERLPALKVWGVGGDLLEKEGMEVLYHTREFSSFGITNILHKIPFYMKAMNHIEEEVEKRSCKVAILIDFQGFNSKLAQRLKKKGVHILYYVAPQAWAWKSWRAKTLARCVDSLFVILPFEKKWFMDRGVREAIHVTHPLYFHYKDEIENKVKMERKKQLLLLPGSRNSEVKQLLSDFIEAARWLKKNHGHQIAMLKTSSVSESWYRSVEKDIDVFYDSDEIAKAMKESELALAASGTVTLSCALFSLPTIVAYRVSLLNGFIGENFVPYKGPFSLANIFLNKRVFPEYIQSDLSAQRLINTLKNWISDPDHLKQLREELSDVSGLIKGEMPSPGVYMSEKIQEAYS